MRRLFLFVLLAPLFMGTPQSAGAVTDPELPQPAVGYQLSVTKYDNVGYDSVLRDCSAGEKLFIVTAKIKRGTPGHFIQVRTSLARFTSTTGEVMEVQGFRSFNKRRLAFMFKSSVPSGTTLIDKAAENSLILATNDPRGQIVLRPVVGTCLVYG